MNIENNIPEVWVLADDKAGHKSQVIGVAEALGLPFVVKNIIYNEKARLPNILKGASLLGVNTEYSDKFFPPWPDILIAAGRRTAPISRYIKKNTAGKCFTVQLMWPGLPAGDFNIIAVPEHDNFYEDRNVIVTVGAPHRVTSQLLKQEVAIWNSTIGSLSYPVLALLVGGSTGKHEFTADHARKLGQLTKKVAEAGDSSVIVTTSRRTPEVVTQILKDTFKDAAFFFDWNNGKANPYYAFLGLANTIVVTGDSISMCSEACATGKPVYIYAPADIVPKKHRLMHESLYKHGFAKELLERNLNTLAEVEREPLNVAKQVADRIKKLYRSC